MSDILTDIDTEGPGNVVPAAPPNEVAGDAALILDIDGFEGPLDLLLGLARSQKLDLLQVSILQLARQYLDFVEKTQALRIELAGDYLVMAAWLAFLKSRLLLPPDPDAEGPSADDLAAHLAFQLKRLDAMRRSAALLMARDRLGVQRFARGAPEPIACTSDVTYRTNAIDLMRAYARLRTRDEFRPFAFDRSDIFTMEQALERIRHLIGYAGEWTGLAEFLPDGWSAPDRSASAKAATFAATLELARQGRLQIRQDRDFGPIEVRHNSRPL